MLIAPIFHNNYLTPNRVADPQQRLSETSLNNSIKSNDGNTSGTYSSLLKSAFNRGTELLKSTFFTTPLVTNSPQSAKRTQHPDSPITISSRSTSADASSSSDSDSQSDEEDASSPDSIKTELMLFKPISREPRTASANAVLIRVPSFRSTSSSSSVIHSPCPSPFTIPLTPCRQSAFSFVVQNQSSPPPPPKPKTSKRKLSKASPEKKSEGTSSKRQKKSKVATVEKVVVAKTRKNMAAPPVIPKKTECVRETRRSMRISDPTEAKPIKVFKSPLKPAKRKGVAVPLPANKLDDSLRRVTRSMKT